MPDGGFSGPDRPNSLVGGQDWRVVYSQHTPDAPCVSVCGIYAAIESSSMELHGHVAEGWWGLLDAHYTQRHLEWSVYVLIRLLFSFFFVAVAVENKFSAVVRWWERCQSDALLFSTSCTTTCDTLGTRTPSRPQTSAILSPGTRWGVVVLLALSQFFMLVAQASSFSFCGAIMDSSPKNRVATYLFQRACLLQWRCFCW